MGGGGMGNNMPEMPAGMDMSKLAAMSGMGGGGGMPDLSALGGEGGMPDLSALGGQGEESEGESEGEEEGEKAAKSSKIEEVK